jgi:flavocytochrome c
MSFYKLKHMTMEYADIVIVGAGLAGIIAALSASDAATAAGIFIHIVILEKQNNLGGNSAKASSGMNAVQTLVQLQQQIFDSTDCFYKDTIASGDDINVHELVHVLSNESKDAWEYLKRFGIELNKISQLGGHSFPRTHRQQDSANERPMNVGFFIISKLIKEIQSRKDITVLTEAKVEKILKNDGRVAGVEFKLNDGQVKRIKSSSVVLTTGGYGSDFSQDGFLMKYNPLAYSLSTTNGDFASGDGVRLGLEVGAGFLHMDKVQIHPTSFIDPKNPFEKTKILAAEALRGHGGILINSNGFRFVNELDRRDVVTNAIFEHCQEEKDDSGHSQKISYLILNEYAKNAFGSGFGFYMFKGLFQQFDDLLSFSKSLGIDFENLQKTIQEHNEASKIGFDAFGKKVFPTTFNLNEKLFVAKITPSVHYTMGGLSFSAKTEILDQTHQPIPGLFGAGEVTGGVHGENRLGGNSLLECVVFGRRAGFQSFSSLESKK